MTQTPESTKARMIGAVTSAAPDKSYAFGDWLDQWEIGPVEYRIVTMATVHRILGLQDDVESLISQEYRGLIRSRLLKALDRAGSSVARGGGTGVADAICDAVKGSLEKQRQVNTALAALGTLFAGLIVQGSIITFAFIVLANFEFPDELLGIKTLTLVAVGISGIVGSLARTVHEARTGRDTPSNLGAMAIIVLARPILAAVLVLFVFTLFQSELLGIPYEASDAKLNKFDREDYFFIAIAFAVGFNDTLGLNVLGVVSRYLPGKGREDEPGSKPVPPSELPPPPPPPPPPRQ